MPTGPAEGSLSPRSSIEPSPRGRRGVLLGRRGLSLLVVGLLMVGGFSALAALSPPARAAGCDLGGTLVNGNWTIATVQVCSGIVYTVDGSVTIATGGSLTLIDGGLRFAKDGAHPDSSLTVDGGGELVLDHSIITVQTYAIDPYLKLALTVSGPGSRFTMANGSILQFPGWFNATDATINVSRSTITGFTNDQLVDTGLYVDDNNDSALLSWASTTATLSASRVDRLYENWSGVLDGVPPAGIVEGDLRLTGGSVLRAYDTYVSLDYSNITGLHNELQVDDTSAAYLYNVTLDGSQNPAAETSWQPALVPTGGGRIGLHRWLHVSVFDETGIPVPGATVWSILSPNGTTAVYPDNASSTIPSGATLGYLGRAASGANAWNRTDANGTALIPLFTDEITGATLPNADSFGNYELAVAYGGTDAASGVSFNPYPALAAADNNAAVRVVLSGVQVPTPADLALDPTDYAAPVSVTENTSFVVYALIYNLGRTPAANVSVAAFLDGNRSNQVARADGLTIATFLNESLNIPGIGSAGTYTLELVVDPNNAIPEGGAAQEANNFANVTVEVRPPVSGYVAIQSPSPGASVKPGDRILVTGYVRDSSLTGLSGVPLTVELRSATGVLAANTTTSGANGFFLTSLLLPADVPQGSYTLVVNTTSAAITADSRGIAVEIPVALLNGLVPLLGIPLWLFLILLVAAIAVVLGLTVYLKVYGLGKMVECGECGAFIHADAARCPKCGVEFEKDLAKCSNCQAWIPEEVRQCPECGVEFATGQLNAEDYQEKMRLQYEEVVEKFRAEAQRQLHRPLSDDAFQKWWRMQPTFVTYEEWLKEEEEMRRTGAKACPRCGTLNSLTAKVCHMCGTLLKGQLPRRAEGDPLARPRHEPAYPRGPSGRSMISSTAELEEFDESDEKKENPVPSEKSTKDGDETKKSG